MKRSTARESVQRWNALLSRKRPRMPRNENDTSPSSRTDPFDCTDVAVLPPREMAERVVEQVLPNWKDLDARRIVQEPTANSGWQTMSEQQGTNRKPEGAVASPHAKRAHNRTNEELSDDASAEESKARAVESEERVDSRKTDETDSSSKDEDEGSTLIAR